MLPSETGSLSAFFYTKHLSMPLELRHLSPEKLKIYDSQSAQKTTPGLPHLKVKALWFYLTNLLTYEPP